MSIDLMVHYLAGIKAAVEQGVYTKEAAQADADWFCWQETPETIIQAFLNEQE
jgi:hypothetical protein